jgi:Ca2+-transporting ATPase
LSGNFTELILIGGSLLLGLPIALLPAQILWINLVEDGLPTFALTFEKKEPDIMKRRPEKLMKQPLLDRQMKVLIFVVAIITDFILLGLFWILWHLTQDLAYVRTVVFVGLAIDSLFFIFSFRSLRRSLLHINPFSNTFLLGAISISWLLLLAAIYFPSLQKLLRTVPLALADWGMLVALALINVVLIEFVKRIFNRRL